MLAAQPLPSDQRTPKLIVLLVVDQFRADYIEKFHQQWTRGLRRLVEDGAWFRIAEYPYYNTVTCPGHSSVSTGTIPAVHGIILNGWFDRASGKMVTCTEDPSVSTISYGHPVKALGESLARLRVPTLSDEIRLQQSPPGRVISFSLKARSAATLGGRRPDAVAWFDDDGSWVTSTAFSAGPVPQVADFVTRHPVEADLDKVWERALPTDRYLYEDPAIGISAAKGGMTPSFPHALKGESGVADASFYDRWQSSPYADEYLTKMALGVAEKFQLGKSGPTNMIAISYSTLDKVGHDYGPNSHEIQDVLVRLDRTIGDLFDGLDKLAGQGQYTVALTADHGVAPLPERVRQFGVDAGRVDPKSIADAVHEAVSRHLGAAPPSTYVSRVVYTDIYFQPGVYAKLRAQPAILEEVRQALRSTPGVMDAFTSDQLEANSFDDDLMGRRLARSHFRGRSGDMSFTLRPYWMIQANGTTHGTGNEYDTHVPVLLMGKGIAAGEYFTPAAPIDVAPTLAFLANVTLPRASGRVLTEALTRLRPAPDKRPQGDR
jgi:predicted AlkP superfamily pyrophosphatase or phosphodiesterase